MIYSISAVLIALFHGLALIIMLAGVCLALFDKLKRWPVFEKIYLASAFAMVASFILFGSCFLTNIEQWLWRKADSPWAYSGGCISHYLDLIGIRVKDINVYRFLIASLALGLGSYAARSFRKLIQRFFPSNN